MNVGHLQRDLKYILIVAQCFGILPVRGIHSDDPKSLKFVKKSKRVYYAIFLVSGTCFLFIMNLFYVVYDGFQIEKATTLIFFLNALLIEILFIQLACKWPKFMCHWNDVETTLNRFGYVVDTSKTFTSVTGIILGGAFVEHVLFLSNSVNKSIILSGNGTLKDVVRLVSVSDNPFVFQYIPYSPYLGIFVKIIGFINTFYWNFMDVFIILMSISLASRFAQINQRIRHSLHFYAKFDDFWKHVRVDYHKLCNLCYRLDSEICYIVMVSFGNNLYFILIQLYNSLKKRSTILETVYFFYSFGFLLLRTIAVCLFAAEINEESKKSLLYLNSISTMYYNEEIDRLNQQIAFGSVALSAKNLFEIKRGIIFSMAGTIVTYEIFLLQYNFNINN